MRASLSALLLLIAAPAVAQDAGFYEAAPGDLPTVSDAMKLSNAVEAAATEAPAVATLEEAAPEVASIERPVVTTVAYESASVAPFAPASPDFAAKPIRPPRDALAVIQRCKELRRGAAVTADDAGRDCRR